MSHTPQDASSVAAERVVDELAPARLGLLPPAQPVMPALSGEEGEVVGGGAPGLSEAGGDEFPSPLQGLIDDVRQRIEELNAREAELEAREAALQARAEELQHVSAERATYGPGEASADLVAAQRRLEERSSELNAEAVELITRRQQLDARQRQLHEREEEQERERERLTAEADALRAQHVAAEEDAAVRQAALEQQAAAQRLSLEEQVAAQRDALRARLERVRAQEQELERRVGLARDDIVGRRAELEARGAELDATGAQLDVQRAALEAHESALVARIAEQEEHERGVAARATELLAERTVLDGQRFALQQERRALEEQSRRLERERQELTAREAAFETERSRAAETLAQLAQARTDAQAEQNKAAELVEKLEARRQKVLELQKEVEARTATLNERVRAFRQEREAFAQEAAQVRAAEATLAARRAAALTEIRRQRADLEQARRTQIDSLAQELSARREQAAHEHVQREAALRAELDAQRAAHDERLAQRTRDVDAELELRRADFQRDQELHRAALQTELTTTRAATERELAAQRRNVEAELKARRESVDGDLSRRRAEVEGDLRRRRETLEDEARTTRQSIESDLRARQAVVEAELARRTAELTALEARAADDAERARLEREDAAQLREQADTREAQSRATALSIEVERQAIEHERRALTLAAEELDTLRARRDQEFASLREELAQQAEQTAVAQRAWFGGPRRGWLRSTLLATAAASAAGLGWLGFERPQHEARGILSVTPASADRADAAHEHRAALLRSDALAAETSGEAWRAALRDGRVRAEVTDDARGVWLTLRAADPAVAAADLQAALTAYVQRVQQKREHSVLPAEARALAAWRDELRLPLEPQAEQMRALAAELAILPEPEAASRLIEELHGLKGRLLDNTQALTGRRAELNALLAEARPTATLAPGLLESTLAADLIFTEDTTELRSVSTRYRDELKTALLMLVDPLREMREALEKFAAVLTEQGNLNPPAPVQAVIEQISGAAAEMLQRTRSLEPEWRRLHAEADEVNIDLDAAPLVEIQTMAERQARGWLEALREQLARMRGALDELAGNTDGKPREVVVSAVVRGELALLDGAATRAEEAARAIESRANVELSTLDRQLRGLRMRREQRREAIRIQLQTEADTVAQLTQRERLDAARTAVRALEGEREELVIDTLEKMDARRRVDEAVAKRANLAGRLAALQADQSWRERQVAELDQRLDIARERAAPDQLQLAAVTTKELTPARGRHAGLAAAGAFGATLLVCLAMLVNVRVGGADRAPRQKSAQPR